MPAAACPCESEDGHDKFIVEIQHKRRHPREGGGPIWFLFVIVSFDIGYTNKKEAAPMFGAAFFVFDLCRLILSGHCHHWFRRTVQ